MFIRNMVRRELAGEWLVLLSSLLPIVLGVSLVITLFTAHQLVKSQLDAEQRDLLGSDLAVETRGKPSAEYNSLLADIREDLSPQRETQAIEFPSMIFSGTASSLVQVVGYDSEFPFYGTQTTEPVGSELTYLQPGRVLVEQSLQSPLKLDIGSSLTLGSQEFVVGAFLESVSGEAEVRMSLAPRVITSITDLREAGLLEYGIRQRTTTHFQLQRVLTDSEVEKLQSRADAFGGDIATPRSRKEVIGDSVDKVYGYLQLFSLATLLIGGLGAVSGGVHYAAKKRRSVSVLRCIGATIRELLSVYMLSFLLASLLVSALGALLSVPLLTFLRAALAEFLPVSLPALLMPNTTTVVGAIALGTFVPSLFALAPLLALRKIPALEVLRTETEQGASAKERSLTFALLATALLLIVFAFLTTQAKTVFGFAIGILLIALLSGTAVYSLKRILTLSWVDLLPFGARQGAKSLRRPGSEVLFTATLVAVPLFLVCTLYILQETMRGEFGGVLERNDENLLLFDVQPDQRKTVRQLAQEESIELGSFYPLVSMRLKSINGESTEARAQRETDGRIKWYLTREYLNTYREELLPSETLLAGTMPQALTEEVDFSKSYPVSIEKRMHDRIGVDLGDALVFNVQGIDLRAHVIGMREFDFRGVNPGFFVVFPPGVLDDAPHSLVITGKFVNEEAFFQFKEKLAASAPNISVIDSRTIQDLITRVFTKLRGALQSLGSLFIFATILLLFSTVQLSSGLRVRELRLYKTLGAKKQTRYVMVLTEFLLIGSLGVLAGLAAGLLFSLLGGEMLLGLDVIVPYKELTILSLLAVILVTVIGVTAAFVGGQRRGLA